MEKKYTILLLCFPASGHFNPFFCYGSELAKNKNVKVIMYNIKQNQKMIEDANIEFREADVDFPKSIISIKELRKNLPLGKMLNFFMDSTEKMLPELVRCVQEDGIDLIVYDIMTVYAKWLLKHLEARYKKGELKKPPPKAISFMPSMLQEKGIYPNSYEEKFSMKPAINLSLLLTIISFLFKYSWFCFRNSLPLENPLNVLFSTNEPITICSVFPELQPRSHLFPSKNKFVGSCASEEVRSAKEFQEPLKSYLAPFPERNPLPLVNFKLDDSSINKHRNLIYVSLGTMLTSEVEPFLRIIEGIKAVNKSTAADNRFLMSVGDIAYAEFQNLIKNKKVSIPDNLLIMPKVLQLDVLKRASLYVTHSGQGGTSESIHYGVPMVCIPVMGDQPAVAYRVSDELGLGVRLDFDIFTAEDLKNAIATVLNDRAYLERTVLFSQISRKYNGSAEASKITIEYLQSLFKRKSD